MTHGTLNERLRPTTTAWIDSLAWGFLLSRRVFACVVVEIVRSNPSLPLCGKNGTDGKFNRLSIAERLAAINPRHIARYVASDVPMTKLRISSLLSATLGVILPVLGGCSVLDSAIDGRAHTVNKSASDYASVAILRNIIRAKNYEPLNFVTLTAFTGHDTLNAALPSLGIYPSRPTIGVDNSTVGTTFSNDFNVSVLDDPGSYAALLEPINPALMGLFIKAGYPRELIYLLFIDYIRTPDQGTVSVYKNFPEPTTEDRDTTRWIGCTDPTDRSTQNRPHVYGEKVFNKTVCKIESLVRQGLTVEIDSDFQPSADVIPSYRFCFDPALPVPVPDHFNNDTFTGGGKFNYFDKFEKGKKSAPKCDAPKATNVLTKWTQPESGNPTVGLSVDAAGKNTSGKQMTIMRKARASYTVIDSSGEILEIHTRSVLGAYQFLGQILHDQFTNAELRYADTQDYTLLKPLPYDNGECFVSVSDDGETYCIPKSAANTKRIFSLLRQLTGLLTRPNNQPATPTVRTTN